jgi:hypothetical protein
VAEKPDLPEDVEWPQQTRAWWDSLGDQVGELPAEDWQYLLDTALLHAQLWSGEFSAARELRVRLEQFGVTPVARGSVSTPVKQERKGTPLDEFTKRLRSKRQSGANS